MQPSSTNALIKRSDFLDAYRGLAVLLMMIFHFCWDLRHFGFMEYSIHDPFWVYFRSLILTLFLTAVGWSSYLTFKKDNYWSFWKRDIRLFIAASAISLVTYLTAPEQWIYFGILHFIFIASLLTRPLVRWPIASAALGVSILLIYHTTHYLTFPNAFATITSFLALPQRTLDIVFPFPWIGVILLGPLFGFLNLHNYQTPKSFILHFLAILGRYALPIYLVHQVILFAAVAGFKMVLSLFY